MIHLFDTYLLLVIIDYHSNAGPPQAEAHAHRVVCLREEKRSGGDVLGGTAQDGGEGFE
jgi:hypothetical protein